jgi:spore coat polysaccharide biosynthesis protein SpsF
MRSTRLPGKVLRPLKGMPLLGHILCRLESLSHAATRVIATSVESWDDAIAKYASLSGVECFRGSELDVLARYCTCATKYGFANIVRLTADNPFVDIEELDRLIELHLRERNDYSHSIDSLPVGVGAEIFSLAALQRSDREGTGSHHREHVNEYILENPGRFRVGRLEVGQEKRHPDVRLTVDTDEDFRRAGYVAEHANGKWVTTVEAIALCSRFA